MNHKVGSIPFKTKNGKIAILFVTSQARGRWILPKGTLLDKETHKKGCEREAYEEAGIKGSILTDYPITKLITKSVDNNIETVPVTFYPMEVIEQFSDWPEKVKRQRHWALLKDIDKIASREDYLHVLRNFKQLTPWVLN